MRYVFFSSRLLCAAALASLAAGSLSAAPPAKKPAVATPAKPAPVVWKAQKVDVLSVSLPGDPASLADKAPAGTEDKLNSYKQLSFKSEVSEISVVVMEAKAEPSLRGGFDGGVNSIKAMADEFSMKEAPLKVAGGKDGFEGLVAFAKGGEKLELDMMVFVSGMKMFQIQVVGKPGATKADAAKIRASLKLP